MHLDHETWWVHSLICGGILLVHILDIHLYFWHDLQQKEILYWRMNRSCQYSLFPWKDLVYNNLWYPISCFQWCNQYPRVFPIYFFVAPTVNKFRFKMFCIWNILFFHTEDVCIDAADANIVFFFLLPSPSFGLFMWIPCCLMFHLMDHKAWHQQLVLL